jgi:hypothetical protein
VHPVVHLPERKVQTVVLGLVDRPLEEPALPEAGEVDEGARRRRDLQAVDDDDVVGSQCARAVDADALDAVRGSRDSEMQLPRATCHLVQRRRGRVAQRRPLTAGQECRDVPTALRPRRMPDSPHAAKDRHEPAHCLSPIDPRLVGADLVELRRRYQALLGCRDPHHPLVHPTWARLFSHSES